MIKLEHKALLPMSFALCGALVISGLSVYYFKNKKDKQNAQLELAEKENQDAKKRLDSADKDLRLYQAYEDRYHKFEAMGLLNKEDRADFTEDIVKSGRDVGIFDLKIQMSPQSEWEEANDDASDQTFLSGAQWRRSEQEISFSALHEKDALDFFKALNWNGRLNQFEVCQISSKNITFEPTARNINIECRLNWSTLYMMPKEEVDDAL